MFFDLEVLKEFKREFRYPNNSAIILLFQKYLNTVFLRCVDVQKCVIDVPLLHYFPCSYRVIDYKA